MNGLTQMSKTALSYSVTTAQGGYCEAGNRKALSLRQETVPGLQEQQSVPPYKVARTD